MAIIDQILRIEGLAASIHSKVTSLGISVSSPGKLADDYNAINSIASQTVNVSSLTADTSAVTISRGYYNANSTIAVSVMSAPTVELSSSASVIHCDDKMMDGDITIPAANVYTTGNSIPDNSTGNNGDLFLVV